MIKLSVHNEFSRLRKVILGIGDDFGGCPDIEDAYDPRSKEHILANTFPLEKDINNELTDLVNVFKKYQVEIFRPKNLKNCNQIFARDVGFVIEDQFFVSNMIKNRALEIKGLESILSQMDISNIHYLPDNVFVEGGDVVVSENYLFVGFSNDTEFNQFQVSRTNRKAIDYLSAKFPNKEIIGFELHKSDTSSMHSCLHLDCCFQPLGLGHILIHEDGFKFKNDLMIINDIFGKQNTININKQEMSNMFANIFSIDKNIVISEKKFQRTNSLLLEKGYVVEQVKFSEISKMGGLFRCATLPLMRDHE